MKLFKNLQCQNFVNENNILNLKIDLDFLAGATYSFKNLTIEKQIGKISTYSASYSYNYNVSTPTFTYSGEQYNIWLYFNLNVSKTLVIQLGGWQSAPGYGQFKISTPIINKIYRYDCGYDEIVKLNFHTR